MKDIIYMWKQFNDTNGIDPRITKVIIEELKYEALTKVQHEVLPRFVNNQDVIVKACTGSGKTISYLVPIIQTVIRHLAAKRKDKEEENKNYLAYSSSEAGAGNCDISSEILCLILVPTRELGNQVHDQLLKFKKEIPELITALVIGGRRLENDIVKFKAFTPNIIVSTPSRICKIEREMDLGEDKLKFNNLQMLVLDEADKMLELGFKPELTYLMGRMNKLRRTGVFSATVNSTIDNIELTGMRNPVFVDVQINSNKLSDNFVESLEKPDKSLTTVIEDYFKQRETIKSISQEVPKQLENYCVLLNQTTCKLAYLLHIVYENLIHRRKVMIFFATCNSVDYYFQILQNFINNGYYSLFDKVEEEGNIASSTENPDLIQLKKSKLFKLHSKISQKKRKKEYKGFKGQELSFDESTGCVLLTTDLSSRGIDIPDLDLVVQFDPPKNEEIFVHRVGRTARVGRKGQSILFLHNNHERKFLDYLASKSIKLQELVLDADLLEKTKKKVKLQIVPDQFVSSEFIDSCNNRQYEINLSDKWIYDKAVKAFVSYVKFYSEHDLKFIFDIKLLEIGRLATSLQLIKIPRVKEIINKKIYDFDKDNQEKLKHLSQLSYLDKNVESQMKLKEEKRVMEREERELKKKICEMDKEIKNKRNKQDKKRTKKQNNQREWDDFADEEKLYKKLKKGKITKAEYDAIFLKNFK